ncbi:MAG TPA: hypothetical protein GX392_03045 [Clostridiales bacterium]|nr:hypothetical protein [Clostridiales bacterium]
MARMRTYKANGGSIKEYYRNIRIITRIITLIDIISKMCYIEVDRNST